MSLNCAIWSFPLWVYLCFVRNMKGCLNLEHFVACTQSYLFSFKMCAKRSKKHGISECILRLHTDFCLKVAHYLKAKPISGFEPWTFGTRVRRPTTVPLYCNINTPMFLLFKNANIVPNGADDVIVWLIDWLIGCGLTPFSNVQSYHGSQFTYECAFIFF